MIRVAVFGCGKMGSRVVEQVHAAEGMEIAYLFDPVRKGEDFCGCTISDPSEAKDMKDVDVAVDFTNAAVSVENAKRCAEMGIKLVIGSTGHSQEQKKELESLAEKTAILISPNMSSGVNVFFKIATELVSKLPGYDIELIEAHHKHKKDSPSGTGAKLADLVADTLGVKLDDHAIYGREKGITGPRPDEEIGIHSVRAGDIVGEHTLLLAGNAEKIELTHAAQSRDCFAKGTIKAISFISEKTTGLFDMWDVLGLK